MTTQIRAVFNGSVFCPEEPVHLELNQHYVLRIMPIREEDASESTEQDPAYDLASLAMNTGISDLAEQHDRYLYGLPKRE